MSDTEYHKGKLKKCFNKEMSFEDGYKILQYNHEVEEVDFERKYVISKSLYFINDTWYELYNHKSYDPDYISDWEILPNGHIEFMVSFYNGGACLSEVLEMGLNKVEEVKTLNRLSKKSPKQTKGE